MAGIEKNLNVNWHRQQTLYFCGPAVAQMFLDFVQVAATQPDLWTDIQNNTNGSRPADAPATDHDFPTQVCNDCNPGSTDPERWQCWDTTPEALSTTVAARGSVTLAARYPSTFDQGVKMLIDSLDRTPEVPAFATIHLINHWVLVKGYLRDDATSQEAPIQDVGGIKLNGLYILDPQEEDATERVKLVTVNGWRRKFGLIACDKHQGTYPIVITVVPMAAWVPFVLMLVVGLVAFWLWYIYVIG
jgi:hypothetical protein